MAGGLSKWVRKTLTGLTDSWLDLSGATLLDVTGTYFNAHRRDQANVRLQRYRTGWSFYRGEQFRQQSQDGSEKFCVNRCQPIVDKGTDWLMNAGFNFVAPPGNDAVVPLLDLIWNTNNRQVMLWEHAQMGAVCGDAYLYVGLIDRDIDGQPLPLESQRIIIQNIDAAYVHPEYDTMDPREMTSCMIQYPTMRHANGAPTMGIYTMMIDKYQIVEYWNKSVIENSRRPNPWGRVTIAHTRNILLANSFFGMSDMDPLIPINKELNATGDKIAKIIKYHADPTTIVKGARLENIERGPNNILSGFPEKASISNLELPASNLDAANNYYNELKLLMNEVSGVPEHALGGRSDTTAAGAAGVALEMAYMPLLERTYRKRITYGATIQLVNSFILQILDMRFGVLDQMVQDKQQKYVCLLQWNSPLPQDKKADFDLLQAKMAAGVESKIGAMRELGVKDIKTKALEIMADNRYDIAKGVEVTVAGTGSRPPNLGVVCLQSYSLHMPELETAFNKQDAAFQGAQKAQATHLAKLNKPVQQKPPTIQGKPQKQPFGSTKPKKDVPLQKVEKTV